MFLQIPPFGIGADREFNDWTETQEPMKLSLTESETLFLPGPRLEQNPKDHQM
jgi:hypothetical protein